MNSTMAISLVSPLVAVLIALWGFRRTSRADQIKAFFELQERYVATEVRHGRKLVHQLAVDDVADLAPEARATIGRMLAVLNSIAIAVEGGYVDGKLIERSMGRSYSAAIRAAKPFIDHLEAARGFRPFPFAERFAAKLGP